MMVNQVIEKIISGNMSNTKDLQHNFKGLPIIFEDIT